MKRFFSIIAVLCVLFVSCGETEVSFEFSVEDREVTITKMKGKSKYVTIPSTINDMPVTRIYGFEEKGIESVTFPNSLTRIEGFGYNKLTSITIPSSVRVIETNAFSGNKLTSVTIPDGCTIGIGAFRNNQLTSVTLSNTLTVIPDSIFRDNKLTSITIPSRVREIRASAFSGNKITNITIPGNVKLSTTSWTFDKEFDFDTYYESHGSLAGTYTYSNGEWSRR